MEEAEKLCDRIGIIDQGKIIALDTPNNFKKSMGGDLVTIKTKNPELSELKKMDYIKHVQYENGLLNLTVSDAGSHLQEVLEKVGHAQDVELHSPTMHDVFLKLTGRQIREESEEGEGGWMTRSIHSGNK
jgi:ABC-2 type transport system ATP-binding protein